MNLESQYNLVVIEGRATYERISNALKDVEPEESIRQLQNFIKIYPEFAQAHNDLAVYFYQTGNSLKALAHYEKAHKLAPKNITFLKNLADFYMVELEWSDDAIHIYLDILKDNPFDIEVLNALGAISLQIGRKEQAKQYYNRSLQLDSSSRNARQGLQLLGVPVQQEAVFIPQQMEYAEALRAPVPSQCSFQPPQVNPVQEHPQTPESRYRLAVEQATNNRTAEAVRILEELVMDSPRYALAHNDLGVLYQQAGKMDLALKHQEIAASIDPANAIFQKNLADLFFIGFGEYEKAMTIYVSLLSKAPRDLEILKAIAQICIELDQPDNARHFLEQILAIQPWDQESRAALKQITENKKAETVQVSAAVVSPQEMYTHAQRLVSEQKMNEARDLLEQLVRQHSNYALAHNDLGVLRYQAGDIQGALGCYEMAVELDPTNISFRKNLADLYFVVLGRTDEAIRIYLDLLRLQPRNVETLTGLGQICTAVGRPDEAKTFYRRALEIEPWNAELRGVLQTLL